jgi:hypothetical protein
MNESITWGPIRSILESELSFNTIKEVVGVAGLDVTQLAHLHQRQPHGVSKGELMTAVDAALALVEPEVRRRFLTLAAEEILRRKPETHEKLVHLLERLGWTIAGSALIPVEILDTSDLPELPAAAHEDLIKAAVRFRDGDLTGAVSAACGAVDSTTASVYEESELGAPGDASYQERVKVSLRERGSFPALQQDLEQLGWSPGEAKRLIQNFEGAINQAAYVMQSLRSGMGDVHGSKPSLRALVFDSLKFSQLLVRLLAKP